MLALQFINTVQDNIEAKQGKVLESDISESDG